MVYHIEHNEDGTVSLWDEAARDYMRMSRAKLQALHEVGSVVCAGDCACWKAGWAPSMAIIGGHAIKDIESAPFLAGTE